VIDVDAVLPQWLDEVVYDLDAHIGAETGECVLVAGAEQHMVEAFRAAVREDGSVRGEALNVRFLCDIAHKGCVGSSGQVVAKEHLLGRHANMVGDVHSAGTGANDQNTLV